MQSLQPVYRRLTARISRPSHRTLATSSPTRSQSNDDKTFILPDGRTLGYAEYGSPHGRPLLYFHGYPSSRLEAEPFAKHAASRNIRIISIDRPGFGLSSPPPGGRRSIPNWTQDVHDLSKGLGIDRFAVMGLSGGGPYALACAARDAPTRSMLTGVGLFASGPPWVAGPQHMSLPRRIMASMCRSWPQLLGRILMGIVYTLRTVMSWPFVQRRVDALLDAVEEKAHANKPGHNESSDKPPQTEEEKAQRRATLLRLMAEEPYRQGPDAAVLEAELLSAQDWGFEFTHVDFKPVWIWHGTKDGNAPISMLRYLAERVPNSVLVEFENDTHYTMGAHIEQALDDLMPQKPEEEK